MPVLSTLGAAIANVYGFTSGLIKDQYFNLVSLLLPGNGTNGKQNNSFKDSSVNDFLITPNGNATQGTFSPFSQTGWGNYFNGSSYLQVASNAAFAFGTGDFSIEFWFYPTVAATQRNISFPTANAPIMNMTSSRTLEFGNYGISTLATTSNTLTLNAWNFCAASRVSGTLRLFINGVQGASVSDSTNFVQSLVNIGTDTGGIFATGYMADVRIVKGSGFTTSTVPTAPLTAISGTSLLTCQSNRFRDASGNGFTITTSGSPSVTPFSPFAPTQSYSAAAVGGSGYFDGTGDYLTVADNAAFDLPGDFTIECWLYRTANTANTILYTLGSYASGQNGFTLYIETTNNLRCYGNGGFIFTGTNGLVPLNAWTHIALIRSGTGADNMKCYINGVFDTAAKASNNTSWTGVAANGFSPGSFYDGSYGSQTDKTYMAGLRFIKGQALASGDFTPPSAPLTTSTVGWTGANAAGSLTGTVSLLLNFTNAGVVDATAKNVLETVGNAQISTTQSKWGGGSMRFPQSGTTDYLKEPLTDLLKIGSGDYTFECWLYRSNSDDAALYVNRSTAQDGFLFGIRTNKVFMLISQDGSTWAINTYATTLGNSVPTTTWSHIAISRQGSSWRVFIDGTLSYTSTLSGSVFQNQPFVYVGYDSGVTALNGYIDDLRVTKGYARYVEGTGGNAGKMVFNGTNTLALPTAPFPVQ